MIMIHGTFFALEFVFGLTYFVIWKVFLHDTQKRDFVWIVVLNGLSLIQNYVLGFLLVIDISFWLIKVMQVDLLSLDSVTRFAEAWNARSAPLHVLINNAGIFSIGGWYFWSNNFFAEFWPFCLYPLMGWVLSSNFWDDLLK